MQTYDLKTMSLTIYVLGLLWSKTESAARFLFTKTRRLTAKNSHSKEITQQRSHTAQKPEIEVLPLALEELRSVRPRKVGLVYGGRVVDARRLPLVDHAELSDEVPQLNAVKSSAAKIGYGMCPSLIISHSVAILGMLSAMNPAMNSVLADARKTKDRM